jgi:hypothetical protein
MISDVLSGIDSAAGHSTGPRIWIVREVEKMELPTEIDQWMTAARSPEHATPVFACQWRKDII